MQISQMFKRKPCVFSIECFPPKQTANFDKMKDNLRTMRTLNPDFISVTYGAGGSTGGVSTVEVAEFLKNDLNVEPLAHMICKGRPAAGPAECRRCAQRADPARRPHPHPPRKPGLCPRKRPGPVCVADPAGI